MSLLTPTAFKTLPEHFLNDLLFLRGQRDAIARYLSIILSNEEDDGLIEQIVTYQSANSAYHRLKRSINSHWGNARYGFPHFTADAMDALYLVSIRIARIERERCHIEI